MTTEHEDFLQTKTHILESIKKLDTLLYKYRGSLELKEITMIKSDLRGLKEELARVEHGLYK